MKGIKKKLLGLLGLFVVAAVTAFAVLLPQPGASAANNNNMYYSTTDEVEVRVLGEEPMVKIEEPISGTVFNDRNKHQLKVIYENVDRVVIKIERTDASGNVYRFTVDDFNAGYQPGSDIYEMDFSADDYIYGHYKVYIDGYGDPRYSGPLAEDIIEFDLVPAGGVTEGDDGTVTVDPGVNPDDDRVTRVEVNVYDDNGNLVDELSPQEILSPFDPKEIPFAEKGLDEGWYTVVVTEYDQDGNVLSEREYRFYYKPVEIPSPEAGTIVPAPNTGGFLANLNISRADYVITGILVVLTIAAIGIFLVARSRNKKVAAGATRGARRNMRSGTSRGTGKSLGRSANRKAASRTMNRATSRGASRKRATSRKKR